MQNRLSKLGAQYVDARGEKPAGWYFGAGMMGGLEAFNAVPPSIKGKKRARALPRTPEKPQPACTVSAPSTSPAKKARRAPSRPVRSSRSSTPK